MQNKSARLQHGLKALLLLDGQCKEQARCAGQRSSGNAQQAHLDQQRQPAAAAVLDLGLCEVAADLSRCNNVTVVNGNYERECPQASQAYLLFGFDRNSP